MRVAVASEVRLEMAPDGTVWAAGVPASFWSRYLDVFNEVRVVARMKHVEEPSHGLVRSSGSAISFVEVPHYLGPWQYVRAAKRVHLALREAVGRTDAVILRIGSLVGSLLERQVAVDGRPYGVEVVGDPDDVFGPGGIEHPLRRGLRWWFTREQKRLCNSACAVAYVTEYTLQRKYPCPAFAVGVSDVEIGRSPGLPGEAQLATHYSSLDLKEGDFAVARTRAARGRPSRLVTVGSLSQSYKGTDVLLKAVARSLAGGLDISLAVIGDGGLRATFERQAEALGLGDRVTFLGSLSPDDVRAHLDQSDVFVLPSRTEGLPRAMIEAMARGLPCIGSAVGGIPELLRSDDLFPPNDVESLATKIRDVVTDQPRMVEMARRNLVKASEFHADVLRPLRRTFYEHLRLRTEEWLREHGD
jgi:glycosyltransferase involved in cell wall biosynthesis